MIGNLNTKIFHANADQETNRWASAQIGQHWNYRTGFSTFSQEGGPPNPADLWGALFPKTTHSTSGSQHLEFEVLPEAFARLRTGGRANGGLIDAYFLKSGARFYPDGKHYFLTVFE